jgi:hypothetical protein
MHKYTGIQKHKRRKLETATVHQHYFPTARDMPPTSARQITPEQVLEVHEDAFLDHLSDHSVQEPVIEVRAAKRYTNSVGTIPYCSAVWQLM